MWSKVLSLASRFGIALGLLNVMTRADEFDGVRADIRDFMASQDVPSVAVAVAREGKIVWEEAFGWADVGRRIPATPHTLYSLASISKPITTTGLMILVERGAIALDQPMDDYLGAQKLTAHVGEAREATVRRVANHTSGLPLHYQFFYEDEAVPRPSMDESIRRYGTLVRRPGEAYVYSNFGYGLLEYAIERASGKSYADFLREELFVPLGLTESAVNRTPDFGELVAVRYGVRRAPVPFYDFDHRGASAVFMSAHDLVRFGLFHLRGEVAGQSKAVLKQATLAAMREAPVLNDGGKSDYGIGLGLGERHGLKNFGHTGGMAGVSTILSIYPEEDLVVVVLANASSRVGEVEASILHTLRPQTIRNDHGFKPQSALVGPWKGEVHTYAGRTPVALDFEAGGSVFVRVGSGPRQEASQARLESNGLLSIGGIAGDLGTPDAARYPYTLRFALKLREPDALDGSVSAISRDLPDRVGNALSYWVALRREKPQP
ncbi:MAG: beta-lactamase family protein [Verrucomicrobiae bacterium]|nr:beta-lactamase family protein [Verrucomicrobiae bacterium]